MTRSDDRVRASATVTVRAQVRVTERGDRPHVPLVKLQRRPAGAPLRR